MIRHQWADDLTVLEGDVRDTLKALPDESVQCVVTSPPYWGLRDYGTAQWEGGSPECDHRVKKQFGGSGNKGNHAGQSANTSKSEKLNRQECPRCGARRIDNQIGLEPTPEEFVANMVAVFREVRRVLRKDGTLWLNLGDSYNGSGGAGGDYGPGGLKEGQPKYPGRHIGSLKPKDLVGIPWRVAFALQADGWYLRSDIIWSKPNPMPESVTDRPTKAHEYLFLLSKSASYFYDVDAVRESYADDRPLTETQTWEERKTKGQTSNNRTAKNLTQTKNPGTLGGHHSGRNKRTVWEVATQPLPEAHFATYPPKLIEPCILAGTSPKACPKCRAPWERVTGEPIPVEGRGSGNKERKIAKQGERSRTNTHMGSSVPWKPTVTPTISWQPTCTCEDNDGSGKCIVLDPFGGSGTTAEVALQHGRAAILCELNPEYIQIMKRRIYGTQQQFAL